MIRQGDLRFDGVHSASITKTCPITMHMKTLAEFVKPINQRSMFNAAIQRLSNFLAHYIASENFFRVDLGK